MKNWKKMGIHPFGISVSGLLILVMGIFSCEQPTKPESSYSVNVSGVVNRLNGSPLDSVVITLSSPFRKDTTKSDGTFKYSFITSEQNEVTAKFNLSHLNLSYVDTFYTAVYSPTKKTVALGELKMRGKTPSLDSVVTGKPSARAGVIVFLRSAHPSISIRGAGMNDATNLTFEVRDSLGNPVDEKNKVSVTFKLVTKPDNLTALNRASAITNSLGQVIVQLSAGDKAGIAQVQATTTVKNAVDTTKTDTVKSQVVSITISGGLPVESRFTIGSQKVNIPGLVKYNLRNTITAVVGDTFGNPVQKGTVVYFSTTGGIIQPSATTSEDGTVGVDLITGNPIPPNGIATITAQVGTPGGFALSGGARSQVDEAVVVVDEAVVVKGLRSKRQEKAAHSASPAKTTVSASVFTKTLNVLFTGAPRVTSNDSSFIVPPLGTKQIQFTVDDINGNPMSQGTTIRVTGVGLDTTGAVLSGDLNNSLPDTYDKSYTKFNISIADRRTKNLSANLPITINIEVVGDNGNIKKSFTGILASGVSDSGKVGSISLVNTSVDTLVASGAGSPNSVLIQAKVLTAVGQPSPFVPVNFSIVKSVNGGEYISEPIAYTNANGIASVTLFSGIRSGLVQVQASVKRDTLSVSAEIKNVYIKTGKVSSLSLVSASSTNLSVKGGGGNESAILVFEAKDSLGNTIDGSNQANITMTLQGDTAGAHINPSTVKTDPNTGRVTTSLTAGNQSGIIQVTAQSGSIKSAAIQVSVSGGLPAQSQFTLSIPKKNYSVLTDKITSVSITAGDNYGNPAKSGTLINFKTNGGLIDASAVTNSSGSAAANLQIVNPQPPSGIATVEAKTFGVNGVVVRDTQTIIFSREAIIAEVAGPYANFEIEDGLSKTFQFSVADINGNPLAQGNTITVQTFGTGSANIVLTGDINVTTSDTKIRGVGTTQFSFTARDTLKDEGQGPKPLSFKISVIGPNTAGAVSHTMNGTLKGGAGSGNEGSVASVSYVSSTTDTIVVANGGVPTTDTITFVVRNINLQPVKKAAVQFFFAQSQNASEYLSPSFAVSDDSGRVKVVVHSGIKSGLLKIEARVTAGSSTISSTPVPVYVKTGILASIALISIDKTELAVRGVGGDENAVVTFESRDVLGNPLDFANQTKIFFQIIGGLNFGEQIKPDSAFTDPFTGRVRATLTSGTRSTVLQVVARNASGTIKSSPVPLIIHGGFAVDSLFNFVGVNKNISIYDPTAKEFPVSLGDRYGNPVKVGTAVYFETNAGIITATSFTNKLGNAGASMQVVKDTRLLGTRYVKARTVGENGVEVSKTVNLLMSGLPVITATNVPTDSVTIFDGSSVVINFTIADNLGNPISGGHAYSVSLEGGVSSQMSLSGNISGTLPDTDDKVNDIKFSFNLADAQPNSGTGGNFKIKITVTGVTGTTIKTINGKLLAPSNIIVPPSARVPASIALISTSTTDLSIAGVGGTENATLMYEVRDSVGAPINLDNKAIVQFKINFSPNTFVPGGTAPTILPTLDSTDENGRVRVAIISGTQAGAVQLEAIINLTNPVRTIKSQPVKISVNSGFADQGHFTIAPLRFNFPGLQRAFHPTTITVQVGDKYSNPVKEGTTVYFNSANGVIQTSQGLTDKNGFVTMTLFAGNPFPLTPKLASGLTDGFSRVYARTIGRDSTFVTDSVEILWTGSPIITKTGGPATFTIGDGGSAGPFTFTVADYLGHPMSQGTTITVDGSGLKVSGDANNIMVDTKSSGPGLTSFTVSIEDSNPLDSNPPINSILTVTVAHSVYGVVKLILATGTVD